MKPIKLLDFFLIFFIAFIFVSCSGNDEPDGFSYKLSSSSEDVSFSQNGREATITTRGNQTYEITISGDFSNIVFDSYLSWAEASHHNNVISVVVTQPNVGESESGYINFTVFDDSKSASGKINITFKETTYDDLLDDERAAIKFFLQSQDVVATTPSDISQLQVGQDAPLYSYTKLDGEVYFKIISEGDNGKVATNDKVYIRYTRWNLLDYYNNNTMPNGYGNETDLTLGQTYFYLEGSDTSTQYWGLGVQVPLLVGFEYGTEAYVVVSSPAAGVYEKAQCIPYLYHIRYFRGADSNQHNFPSYPVYLSFTNEAEWNVFGIHSPGDWKYFNKSKSIPSNFNFPDNSSTGFGGVIIALGWTGDKYAFDAACPVEIDSDIIVSIDTENNVAQCPHCGSQYSIFENPGLPLSGKAAENNYSLKRYTVGTAEIPIFMVTN